MKVTKNQHQKPAFSVTSLPNIPEPSKALQLLLIDYRILNVFLWSPKPESVKTKKSKLRPINSFIAFRSFYSRTISRPEYQRELSSKLAEVWKEEPHREVWEQYTLFYNNYLLDCNNKLAFVDWLLQTLELDFDNSPLNDVSQTEDAFEFELENCPLNDVSQTEDAFKLTSGTIQDVYLTD